MSKRKKQEKRKNRGHEGTEQGNGEINSLLVLSPDCSFTNGAVNKIYT